MVDRIPKALNLSTKRCRPSDSSDEETADFSDEAFIAERSFRQGFDGNPGYINFPRRDSLTRNDPYSASTFRCVPFPCSSSLPSYSNHPQGSFSSWEDLQPCDLRLKRAKVASPPQPLKRVARTLAKDLTDCVAISKHAATAAASENSEACLPVSSSSTCSSSEPVTPTAGSSFASSSSLSYDTASPSSQVQFEVGFDGGRAASTSASYQTPIKEEEEEEGVATYSSSSSFASTGHRSSVTALGRQISSTSLRSQSAASAASLGYLSSSSAASFGQPSGASLGHHSGVSLDLQSWSSSGRQSGTSFGNQSGASFDQESGVSFGHRSGRTFSRQSSASSTSLGYQSSSSVASLGNQGLSSDIPVGSPPSSFGRARYQSVSLSASPLTAPTPEPASKEGRLADYLADCLLKYGLCIVDSYMGSRAGQRILKDVKERANQLREGRLMSDELESHTVRGDETMWLETGSSSHIDNLVHHLDMVVRGLAHRLDATYQITSRTKAMVARYAGAGKCYVRHVDNHRQDGRCITCIYYLNPNYSSETDGGVLRMYPSRLAQSIDVEPKFDRVIFFWSDQRTPHEVLPAFRERYAITVWYFDEIERQDARQRMSHASVGDS